MHDSNAVETDTHRNTTAGEVLPPPVPPLPDDVASIPGSVEGDDGQDQDADAQTPKRRRPSALVIALAVTAVVAAAGWTAFGVAFADVNAKADEIEAASELLDDAQFDLTTERIEVRDLKRERDGLQADVEEMTAQVEAVVAKEAELSAREAAVKVTEEYQRQTTLRAGYSYTVGLTMEPGTYRANPTGSSCYWAIYVTGTNYSDIVENDLGSMGTLTVTVSDGQDFQSNRCGDWTKVG